MKSQQNISKNMKTMRTFLQQKLWRDKAVDLMERNHGSKINWRYLNDQEFDEQIRIKLIEETEEVITAISRDDLIAEIADVYEVINSLVTLHNITQEEVIAAQKKKHEDRGGFEGRRFVETAEHPVDSFGERYCLADLKKYPEILEQ